VRDYVALAVFALVYVLIIGRRRFGVPIWAAMLAGAALMVGLQVTTVGDAFRSVNLDVIAFLFGMFSIVSALDRAGVLRLVAIKMLAVAKTPDRLLLAFVAGMGVLAAFLVNDTIALLGIPLAVYVAKNTGIRPTTLLLALAFGITVGSVMTPIGNPQNLLVAIQSGTPLPFITFLAWLAIPTAANLAVTYLILKVYFRKELAAARPNLEELQAEAARAITDPRLARLSVVVLVATLAGFIVSEILHFVGVANVGLSVVAMMGAAVLYALSRERTVIMKSVDYSVLIFFGGMFVVTSAMWSSGAISVITGWLPNPDRNDPAQSIGVITAASLSLSQVLSNVPFVALYNFVMLDNGFTGEHAVPWLMLAAASTVAGNLTILGAASNVIIIEAAEARGVRAFSFFEFAKVGSAITAANIAIYLGFFMIFI
jgi:Na+/H+ antiporter NhaD/arsenite permease-like protein